VPRPWGGRRIAQRFGWDASEPCGEWWLASSYPGTETALRDGSGDLARWLDGPGRALGCPTAADFPVLLKFLDAEEILSLQVHPDDAVARAHGLPNGKTEAWHILDAAPDAEVYIGTAQGVSCTQLLDSIEAGATDDDIRSMMNRVNVQAGDTVFVGAGTIHALAGGVSLFEVQQNSDATYRIHDWGRGREVHLAKTRDAMIDGPPPTPSNPTLAADAWTSLVDCDVFRLDRARPDGSLGFGPDGSFGLLTVLAGEGRVHGSESSAPLVPGDTLLVLEPVRVEGDALDLLAVQPGR
jgi:mannose-6-phosphate isomerase